ncbi:multidrug efflux SMR transporter [Tistrella bauzanensis]|jgi:small multidrug resistance pump|uniref:Multidrug efflux SMR transporter n=1 Tax=Tistrella arctica TaxID=3133430 RepID=A0ABU9YKN6_9PROT
MGSGISAGLAWALLGGAIAAEVIATTSMKLSDGLSRTGPVVVMVLGYLIAFSLLGLALKRIEIGIAYAIWSGVGTALIATIGIVAFGESLNPIKLASLGLIVAGVIGLNLSGGH